MKQNDEEKADQQDAPDRPPVTLQLEDQDSISLLHEGDEANTLRAPPERIYHTVTKTGRKYYRPKHLQKDHVLTKTANAYVLLQEDSSEDESDDDPPPEVAAVGAGALTKRT